MNNVEEMCRLICNKIYTSTREGYGIFYEDELSDILPEESRSRETLEAALKQLMKGGYIDVKYAKGNVFCILGLKKYEEAPPLPCAKRAISKRAAGAALVCAAAFTGGALGSFICGLLF